MTLQRDRQRLNAQQKAILEGFRGPGLVVAGPGTGKTRTIAVLLGSLLTDGNRMCEILALTFSEKAASELRQRVLQYFPHSFDECWISTFHSFSARLLRENFHLVGVHPEFRLLTSFKEALVMADIARRQDVATYPVFGRVLAKRGFQQEILTFIALLKSNLVTPADFEAVIGAASTIPPAALQRFSEIGRLYREYERVRTQARYLDFRDLIGLTLQILREGKVAQHQREKFRFVLVDEFQDTDPAQFLLIDLLKRGEKKPKLMVIGDPRQSIYRFRGADPGMMGEHGPFQARFKGRVFSLAQNYRSGSAILARARALRWATSAPDSTMELSAESGRTGFVEAWSLRDELDEARFIARRVAVAVVYGLERLYRVEEVAILVRNNYQIDLLTEALRVLQIPFAVAGDIKFYRADAVTTVISLLKAAFGSGSEREASLRRAFAGSVFNFPDVWVQRVFAALGSHCSLENLLNAWNNDDDSLGLLPEGDDEVKARVQSFASSWNMLPQAKDLSLNVLVGRVLSLITDAVNDPTAPQYSGLLHFRSMIYDYAEVFRHLESRDPTIVDLLPELDEWLTYYANTLEHDDATLPAGGVRIMTVHQAKGLEFPLVFVCGLSDGVFPVQTRENLLVGNQAVESLKQHIDRTARDIPFFNPYPLDATSHLEEERRLFYVAMTRAKEGLILTCPRFNGTDPVQPAPFFREIDLLPRIPDGEERPLSPAEFRKHLILLPENDRERLLTTFRQLNPELALAITPRALGTPGIDAIDFNPAFSFSATSLERYLECPRRFFFLHILRLRDPRLEQDASLLRGKALHACLERLHRKCRDGDLSVGGDGPTDAQLQAIWLEEGKPSLAPLDPLTAHHIEHQIIQALQDYRQAVFCAGQLPFDCADEVEKTVRFSHGSARFSARFDRILTVGNGRWIIDYKSSSNVPSSKLTVERHLPVAGNLPQALQMTLYLLAARTCYGPEASVMLLYPLGELYKRPPNGFQKGFMRSTALNLGTGPAWGHPLSEEEFASICASLQTLTDTILRDRTFDCKPSTAPEMVTCRQTSARYRCQFQAFCQERLDRLRISVATEET